MLAAALLLGPLSASIVARDDTPAPVATESTAGNSTLTDEQLAALAALANRARAWQSATIELHTHANAEGLAERRAITIGTGNRMSASFFTAPSESPQSTPDRPTLFVHSDGTKVRGTRAIKPDVYVEGDAASFWGRPPGPMQVRACPWPVLPQLVDDLRTSADTTMERTPEGLWRASSETLNVTLIWTSEGVLRSFSTRSGIEQITLTYEPGNPGEASASTDPSTDTPNVARIVETIASLAAPAPESDAPVGPLAPREVQAAGSVVPSLPRTLVWTVTALRTNPSDAGALFSFDPAAKGLKRWNVETGEITDATGKVVGVEKIPAVDSMERFFEAEREKRTREMRANPHGVPMSEWLWWLAAAVVLCVVVDQIRRRL